MQFTVNINQAKALEWELNAQQAMLFAFVYECPAWTKPVTTNDGVFFALSKAKIVEELPLLTDKPDTAYRLLKALETKGVIELSSTNSITLVRLTDKGKTWNKKLDGTDKYPSGSDRKKIRGGSEKSPSQVGKKSEAGSEKSPTNQGTSNQGTNHDTSNQETPVPSDDVTSVFEFWKNQMGKTRTTKLDNKRRTKIKSALADYGLEQVQQAIIGCTLSAHHMGQNPQNKRYDDIELILRDAKHVEQFLGYYDRKPTNVSLYDNRPRPVHSGLANASAEGLRRRADGAYSL